ncbi:MAG: ABC transporter permease [Gammaproteobacteria bacterium]
MIYWSIKTLFSEPMRLFVSALAVAVSFLLVIFFSAVFEGESKQMVLYLKKMQADVWVMQKGVSNMHMSSSMLWDWKADKIAKLPEVDSVTSILYLNGPVKIGGKNWYSYVIGITPENTHAGPWDMAQGKAIPDAGEAVISEITARLTGIQIGDEIFLVDRTLRVVGLSRHTFSMASSIVFVSREDLGDIVDGPDQVSYIMVKAKAGVSSKELISRIKDNVNKVNALSSDDFIKSDWQLGIQMGAEIIQMMTFIGTVLATLIVAFTAYSLIAHKKQELAIAKALGFGNNQIYMAALSQSVIITGSGLLLTIIISYTLLIWLPVLVPQINLSLELQQFIPLSVLAFPIALIASFTAARSVVKVDPVSVFSR